MDNTFFICLAITLVGFGSLFQCHAIRLQIRCIEEDISNLKKMLKTSRGKTDEN